MIAAMVLLGLTVHSSHNARTFLTDRLMTYELHPYNSLCSETNNASR